MLTDLEMCNGYYVVYVDGCCFGNGQEDARAGIGVFWADDHDWSI